MINRSAEYRIKTNKILVIALIWIIIGAIITFYDNFAFHSLISAGTSSLYGFFKSFFINTTGGLMGGLIVGSFLVFYVNEKFRDKPYWITILLVSLFFTVIFTLISSVVVLILSAIQAGNSLLDPITLKIFKQTIFDTIFFKDLLVWSIIVALTQFFLQVNDKFGQGLLWSFIRGRYHTPREENRIFMFVDLASSTTIAEKLSIRKYHDLLHNFYADITNAIIYNKGEIYQYVGDKIIISWKIETGIIENQCLKCYFDMRKTIAGFKEKYESRYGLVPDFKAGLHYGKVIAGEIGIIKRDVTFSGDVMNTTSRIQSMCNEYNVKILSSDELLQLLPYDSYYRRIPIGDIKLKGKEKKVALSTVEMSV